MADFFAGRGVGGFLPPPPGKKPPNHFYLLAQWAAIPPLATLHKIDFYCHNSKTQMFYELLFLMCRIQMGRCQY